VTAGVETQAALQEGVGSQCVCAACSPLTLTWISLGLERNREIRDWWLGLGVEYVSRIREVRGPAGTILWSYPGASRNG
jgi:hypothetical protein